MTLQNPIPVVMTFAGADPTGGAGIQADIEAIASMGCHACAVITTITVQDTQNVSAFVPLDMGLIVQQARAVLEDMPVAAFKIGMVGSVAAVEAIHTLLTDYPNIPVVLDPILKAGGGAALSNDAIVDAISQLLIPLATIVTPNSVEARRLAPHADNLEACAQEILDMGCEYVLVTGTHENTANVVNSLYTNRRLIDSYTWQRLPHTYHGSGCTLAASIAGLLGQGYEPISAVFEAQQYTWSALANGTRLGMGQWLPNRFFWAQHDEEVAK